MDFTGVLNTYMKDYSLTVGGLKTASGLSGSTISRLRKGLYEPAPESETFQKLVNGLAIMIKSADGDITKEQIEASFGTVLKKRVVEFQPVVGKLNILIKELGINANDLSRYLRYDASYLSRIRSGKRQPAKSMEFCEGVADFVAGQCLDQSGTISELIGCDRCELETAAECKSRLLEWLIEVPKKEKTGNTIEHFLYNLDQFDLNQYIQAISFPSADNSAEEKTEIVRTKDYFQIQGFMQAELDWLQIARLCPAGSPVLFFSDMPMQEMAKDPVFPKKWMFGVAMLLKSGIPVNIIHNLDRSFYEMMLGLESWIPLYMTGLVTPYYFEKQPDSVFHHFIRVAENAALQGEAIIGRPENGKYHLTTIPEELSYYKRRGEDLLAKAKPLLKIYGMNKAKQYQEFIQSEREKQNEIYRNLLSAPPIYTITEELLCRILEHNHVSEMKKELILQFMNVKKKTIADQMQRGKLEDEMQVFSREQFNEQPLSLDLSELFPDQGIIYEYTEYLEHVQLTRDYAEHFGNYQCRYSKRLPYRNIQIRFLSDECVILSKNKYPCTHFVIYHAKLIHAIENIETAIGGE